MTYSRLTIAIRPGGVTALVGSDSDRPARNSATTMTSAPAPALRGLFMGHLFRRRVLSEGRLYRAPLPMQSAQVYGICWRVPDEGHSHRGSPRPPSHPHALAAPAPR